MIKVENIDIWGFEHAIRGMRNPMNSWEKSDSYFSEGNHAIGDNDLALMKKLFKAGTEHRKYLRQIMVSMDITAPLYWWKEFDTYKVGTVANSCSTMHKIAEKEFTLEDFSCEHLINAKEVMEYDFNDERVQIVLAATTISGEIANYTPMGFLRMTCDVLNHFRNAYLKTKDKLYWWQMIQLLPSSYNQKRTVTMNYENVVTIIQQRTGHKLDEWNNFVDILKELPLVEAITEGD